MAALDLKDLKLFEAALDGVADKFKDIGDDAKDASKEVEEFEKRIVSLIIKTNPLPRLVKDINDQLSRQADQMRQTTKAVDEMAQAYDRLNKAQRGLPSGLKQQGPKFGSAAKAPIDKSPIEPPEPPSPAPVEPRQRPKRSIAGGLNKSEAEALGSSTIDAIASLAKGDDVLKVMIDLGKDVADTFLKASLEGIGLGTELKRMGVSAGVLRVVDKDAKAAQAGLSVLTAVTDGLTAATIGSGEAATAAGAAEMVALTPVGLLLAGIAVAVGTVATVFAVTAQQIGKSTGENLDHLKLTEEQLARVKDKGVTMGDVLSGVWKTTADMLREAFGPALKWLGDFFGKVYQGAVDGALWLFKSGVQAIGGLVGGFKAFFGGLGPAIGDLVISGLNIAGEAVEKLINMAIGALNSLVRMANNAAEKVGLSVRLPELKPISIGQLDNPFEGKAAAFGKDFYKGVIEGADGAGKALDALGDRMVKNIVKARDTRAIEKAGKGIKDAADAACNCGSNVQNVANDNRSYRSGGVSDFSSDERGVVTYKDPISVQEPLKARPALATEPLIDTGLEAAAKAIEAVLNPLDAMVDKLTDINTLAPELGKQFEAAFGQTGKAMGGVLTGFSAFALEVAKIKQEAAGADLSPEQEERKAQAQIKAYGAMAGAAKGFFKENSDGYKAMQVAEIAFHTIETLNTIKTMGLRAADTASAVTGEGAKQAAYGATAYAKTLSGLPFPFNLLAGAAVLAALVQAGAAIKGKPGGGSIPGANDMKTRQDAQGSGSVLGDDKAKSESLEKALTHAQAYENKDLEYGNAMVRSLKSIDDQIGAVAAALAKSFGAGGMLSTEGLSLGKTGTSATLSNLGFSKSTTRTLQDQGVQFDAASLADIIGGGLAGSTYQQVLETTKKKAFGITTSNKSKVITETGALDSDFLDQITKLITSLGKGVAEAAGAIKATGVEEALAAFKVDLGKLSFKDMTGTQIEEALNAIFGKLGDDMAKAAAPAIAQFQKVGEGAFETLVRVARQYEVIDTTLKSVGMTFATMGVASLEARERLFDLVGGLDALTDQTAFFAEHFLSESERLKPVKDSVTSELGRLGLPADLTRDGFKTLVLAQDVATEKGAKLYAALMALAPAFDKVATAAEAVRDKQVSIQEQIDELTLTSAERLAKSRAREMEAVKALDASLAPFLETLWKAQDAADAAKLATDRSNLFADLLDAQGRSEEAKALRRANALAAIEDPIQKQYQQQIWAAEDAAAKVSAARDVLTQAYQREHDALQATKDKFAELSRSLRTFSNSLSATIAGSDLAGRYRTTRQAFLTTASLARLGDPDAMGRLQAEGEAFTAASRDYVSTGLDYLRDVGLVRAAVDEAADTADRQVSIAEQQLEALDASVQGLIQVNASVVSVRDAIAGLRAANQAAAAAGVAAAPGQPTNSTSAGPANGTLTQAQKDLNNAAWWWGLTNSASGKATADDPSDINRYAQGMAARYSPGYMDIVNTQGIDAANAMVAAGQLSFGQAGGLKFATGGGFEVGGSGPPDSKLFNLALSPGEAVNVRRRGDSGDETLVNELRRLRDELADLRATSARIATSNDKMERTLTNVTEGGRAMQTQAAA